MSLESVERWAEGIVLSHNIALEPPGHNGADLVLDVDVGWDSEDVVQLLERPLLGLWHEQEDHEKGGNVETGVETEGTRDGHSIDHPWEGDGEHSSPEEASCDRPSHTDLCKLVSSFTGRRELRASTYHDGTEGRPRPST